MVDYLIGKVPEKLAITLKTLKEQMHADLSEKQMCGHHGLKVELYEVLEVRVIEGQRGKNVCLAVSPMIGLVHWMTFDDGMTYLETFSWKCYRTTMSHTFSCATM